MLIVPPGPGFRTRFSNVAGVRPATNFGTTVTPGASNTFGSFAQLLAGSAVTAEGYGIAVNINSNDVSTAARDTLVTLGLDPAGGTTYTDWILHLVGSCGATYPGGHWYYFPVRVPSGASIGAKASVNNATAGTLRAVIWVFADPERPEFVRVGQKVQTIGAVTASSAGTAVTSGTTADGTWTSLGTVTDASWWWQVGMGVNDATMSNSIYHLDLAAESSTSPKILLEDVPYEHISFENKYVYHTGFDAVGLVKGGQEIFARLQASVAADASLSVIAYAVSV